MDEPKLNSYIVYKHTAPNGKIYIGITSLKFERRCDNGNGYRNNSHFTSAIKKYGWNNITHEILFTGLTKKEAELKEVELIRKYKSDNREYGYNIKDGGGVHRQSEETKKKLSESHKGKKLSDEHIRKIKNTRTKRKVVMLDKYTDEIINTFDSICDACVYLGNISYRSNIVKALKGKYKYSHGYKWKYLDSEVV